MRKKITFVKIFGAVVVLLLVTSTSVVGINGALKTSKIEKQVTNLLFEVDHDVASAIDIAITVPSFEFGPVQTKGGTFATVLLTSEGTTNIPGEAQLPSLKRMVEIPQGAKPEIIVTSISWESTSLNKLGLPSRIVPAQPSIQKIPRMPQEFVIDEEYYNRNEFSPRDIAKIIECGEIRGHRFALAEISPIQYNPVTGELKIMASCKLTITLEGSDLIETAEKIQRYSSPSFEKMFKHAFVNYGFYENGITERDQEGYLIIVYDNFYEEIQPLANWKNGKGYDVTTTKTSQIPGGPTKDNIYNYIEDAYDTWTIPPTYVLLAGDVPQIPTFTGSASYSEADLYYVTVDGSDYFPDIHIGRFPAAQESQIVTMVDKTIYYETGSFPSNDWIKKAAFIASSDYGQLAEQTHNYVIDNFLNPNGYTCDKIYEASGGSTSDIINSLNDGRSLCIYSGHGYSGGWGCVPFDQSDINSLTNDGMYPFVCSHACSTNPFGNSECFGETWLRAENKGGIAFWGASASTYWDEDDILERAMFQAWWSDGLEWIGGMTDMALIYLYQNYSGGGLSQYYFECYNINGDPSLRLWSDNPSGSPATPTQPDGPTEGIINEEYTFSSSTTDPEGDDLYYMFDWGDNTNSGWIGPYTSGQTVQASHIWTAIGNYDVQVKAKDECGVQSGWSPSTTISIVENTPPNDPSINGPTNGEPGKTYLFRFTADDPSNHDVFFYVDWGDDTYEDWFGPYDSGEEATTVHSWAEEGTYTVKVKAKDIFGAESGWTTLEVEMPVNQVTIHSLIMRLIYGTS